MVKKVVAFFSAIKYNFANGEKPYISERMLINEKDQTMLVIDPNGGYAARCLEAAASQSAERAGDIEHHTESSPASLFGVCGH